MSLVFINYPLETFTPTGSGALATIIWECCRRAERQGVFPWVITRRSVVAPFPWKNIAQIDYEERPQSTAVTTFRRAERKLFQWRHMRYRIYVARVIQALRQNDLTEMPFVLFNDPELAVLLRRRFPRATILHWFQNQMDAKPAFRSAFASAVTEVAACSKFTGSYVSEYFGMGNRPVRTLYNATDTELFTPASEPPAGDPIINFVGRTGREKAPDLVLRAAKRLVCKTKSFGIQLIGSNHWGGFELDDYQRQLNQLVEELEGEGIVVRRPGHVGRPEMPDELRKAHIHVMPSRWDEPFGMASLEGMACGLATVASRTGGTPEVIGDEGFLFERDSEEELAEALYKLITDSDLRAEYGRRARSRSLVFTWEQTWQELRRYTGI